MAQIQIKADSFWMKGSFFIPDHFNREDFNHQVLELAKGIGTYKGVFVEPGHSLFCNLEVMTLKGTPKEIMEQTPRIQFERMVKGLSLENLLLMKTLIDIRLNELKF